MSKDRRRRKRRPAVGDDQPQTKVNREYLRGLGLTDDEIASVQAYADTHPGNDTYALVLLAGRLAWMSQTQ